MTSKKFVFDSFRWDIGTENYRLCKEGAHPALLLTILKHDNISIPDVLVLLATTILVSNSKGTNKTCSQME